MSTTPVGMGAQDSAERGKFENEVRRITEAGNQAGLMLRVLGSLAEIKADARFKDSPLLKIGDLARRTGKTAWEIARMYTGKHKIVDSGGRVDKFRRRYAGATK